MNRLKIDVFFKLINIQSIVETNKKNIKFIRFLLNYYYYNDRDYYKQIMYSKNKNNTFIDSLIHKYPIMFNYILGIKLNNIELKSFQNDIFFLLILLNIIKQNLAPRKVKYKIFIIKEKYVDSIFSVLQDINKDIFYLYLVKFEESDDSMPEHIIISYKNQLYDIMNNKMYIQNTSCVINSFCFILETLQIPFNINNISTIFYFLRHTIVNLNKYYK